MNTFKKISLAIISGIVLVTAFPPRDWAPLAWVALVPLFISLRGSSFKLSLLLGLCSGFAFFLGHFRWVDQFGHAPYILMSLVLSLTWLIYAGLLNLVSGKINGWRWTFAAAALWPIIEWLRGQSILGVSWGYLGLTQYRNLEVAQLAGFTGIWGVTFLVVLVNAEISELIITRRLRCRTAAVMASVIAVMFIGHLIIRSGELNKATIPVAVIQGNVDQDTLSGIESFNTPEEVYGRLSVQANKVSPKLIIWPETVVPGTLDQDRYMQYWIGEIAKSLNTDILAGSYGVKDGKPQNCAFLINSKGVITGRYAKVHLVPFGEFVPWRKYLPLLEKFHVRPVDVYPGDNHNPIKIDGLSIGTVICFESAFGGICRQTCNNGGNVLVTITYDTWYNLQGAAAQHVSMAPFRAIENNCYFIQGAARGISCIVNPHGRILDHLGTFKEGVVIGNIAPSTGKTIYQRFGDWFIYAMIIFFLGIFIYNRNTLWEQGKITSMERMPEKTCLK